MNRFGRPPSSTRPYETAIRVVVSGVPQSTETPGASRARPVSVRRAGLLIGTSRTKPPTHTLPIGSISETRTVNRNGPTSAGSGTCRTLKPNLKRGPHSSATEQPDMVDPGGGTEATKRISSGPVLEVGVTIVRGSTVGDGEGVGATGVSP